MTGLRAGLELALARRELLRIGGMSGLGMALMPGLAAAAERPEIMANVRALVERWVGPGKFPGMIATLGLPGRDPEYVLRGSEGFTDPDPMTPDSLFRIYSMTKPITGMATMMLIDEGKLAVDQPLAEILPKYAKMQVQVTPDGSITDLRPAKAPILIRHLLTHTSGLGYSIIQKGPIKQAMIKAGVVAGLISAIPIPGLERGHAAESLEIFADRLAGLPLVYEPGTTWSYSLGLDLLGRVIEVVSGQRFDAFLRDRLFGPAGMDSTFFQVPSIDARRLTTNYAVLNGIFVPIDKGGESVFLEPPPFPFGGSGLVSTARDYDRFLRMLAQFGMLGGVRVMSERAVRIGTGDLLPPAIKTVDTFAMGGGFGAGGRVGRGAEAGIFGWAGAAGTVGTVDIGRGIRAAIYEQFMPPDAMPVLSEYQHALRADVIALLEKSS